MVAVNSDAERRRRPKQAKASSLQKKRAAAYGGAFFSDGQSLGFSLGPICQGGAKPLTELRNSEIRWRARWGSATAGGLALEHESQPRLR